MKKLLLVLSVLLLTACSTKFAYNNASWLVYWYLDDYVELNNSQEDKFDEMLERWLTWHKQSELPKYQLQLEDLIKDIKLNNINYQTITLHRERVRQHWARARAHISADVVELASTLSDQQIDNLFANLEEKNQEDEDEWLEKNALDDDERAKEWIERNEDNAKKWIGRLNQEQQVFVRQFQQRFISTQKQWITYKREYQKKLREVFAMPTRGEEFQTLLHSFIVEPEKYRSEQFQATIDQNNIATSEYIVGLMSLATNKQIHNLVEEIDDLRQDVINLQK